MYGAVGAIAVGLLGLIAILATGSKPTTDLSLTAQIQAYGAMGGAAGKSGVSQGGRSSLDRSRDRPGKAAERALASNKNLEARIAHSLEAAGMSLKASEWLLLRAAIAVGGGLLGVLLGSGNIVLGVLFVVAALIGPWFYLRRKRKKRLTAFGTGLADTLAADVRQSLGRALAGSVHRHHRARGGRPDLERVPPGGHRDPARRHPGGLAWRASPSAWRAVTSSGS